jgi:hypothetical protein
VVVASLTACEVGLDPDGRRRRGLPDAPAADAGAAERPDAATPTTVELSPELCDDPSNLQRSSDRSGSGGRQAAASA